MNISLDTLRGLADRQNIVFNSDRQNVERASARQSIGSLFGTKNAKALNHKTFDEIKTAVLSDPRYFGVREKANELLSTINADKAIKSRDIKNIVKQLDDITSVKQQKAQLKERISAHLAMRELPVLWKNNPKVFSNHLDRMLDTMIREAGGAGKVNISAELQKLCDAIAVIEEKSNGDANAIDFALAIFERRSQIISTPEDATKTMTKFMSVVGELQRLDADNPGTHIIERGVGIMKAMSSTVKPEVMTALKNASARIDPALVANVAGNVDGADVSISLHQMLKNLFATVAKNPPAYPQGAELDDSDGILSALNFIYGDFAASLPQDTRESLLRNMTGESALNLRSFYEDVGGKEAINSIKIFDAMVKSLQESLGQPAVGVNVPDRTDFSRIPLKLKGEYPVQTIWANVSGDMENNRIVQWRQGQMQSLQAFENNRFVSADEKLRDVIRDNCTHGAKTLTFAGEMKKLIEGELSTFEKDIVRFMNVKLPNGVRLPYEFEGARNEIVKYVSGGTFSTYQEADLATQKKACLMMSFLSQETEKLLYMVAVILPQDNGIAPAHVFADQNGRSFSVSETADGGWDIRCDMTMSLACIVFPPDNALADTELRLGPGSKLDGEIDIKLSREEIARLSQCDAADYSAEKIVPDLQVEASIAYTATPQMD